MSDPKWLTIAMSQIGVAEIPGPKNNPEVAKFGGGNDNAGWCCFFVNWCLEQAGLKGSKSGLAMSWLRYGNSLSKPRKGCIAVIAVDHGRYHVGFWLSSDGSRVQVLGGNQSDQVKVSNFAVSSVVGYRWPKE